MVVAGAGGGWVELRSNAEGTAGSSELLRGWDPDVGARLLLNDQLDLVVDLL